MDLLSDKKHVTALFHEMWNNENYITTKHRVLLSATNNAPLLTAVAVSFEKRCSGSLGTRSSRKQLQCLVHLASGNEVMRVNSGSSIPSTSALCICAFIGKGKTKVSNLMRKLAQLFRNGVSFLDEKV